MSDSVIDLMREVERWKRLAAEFREAISLNADGSLLCARVHELAGIARGYDSLTSDCPLPHPHSGPHPIPGVPNLYAHSRIETTGPNGGVRMEGLFWERKAGE